MNGAFPPKNALTLGRNRYHSMDTSMTSPTMLGIEPKTSATRLAKAPRPERIMANILAHLLPVHRPHPTRSPSKPNMTTTPPTAIPTPAGTASPRAEKSVPLTAATARPSRSMSKPPRISKTAKIAIPIGLGGLIIITEVHAIDT